MSADKAVVSHEQIFLSSVRRPEMCKGPSRNLSRLCGFTLVELLVVIGIIALLISILLPSLAAARRQATRTACAAKLHQIMLAAEMHRNDHHDYYPLAGALPGNGPVPLEDPYKQKYDYYAFSKDSGGNPIDALCPITYALLTEMMGNKTLYGPNGILGISDYSQETAMMLDPNGPLKYFICPAHVSSPLEIQPKYEYLFVAGVQNYCCQPQSYIYNEYLLGWNDNLKYLKGKASMLRQPAKVMFAADGLGGATSANHTLLGGLMFPMYTVYNNTTTSMTLADAFTASTFPGPTPNKGGDKKNFDLIRHKGTMNIAFCDSHVESRAINANDLANVFITPP